MQRSLLLQLLSRHALLLLCLQVTNDTASEAVDTRRRLLVNKVSNSRKEVFIVQLQMSLCQAFCYSALHH